MKWDHRGSMKAVFDTSSMRLASRCDKTTDGVFDLYDGGFPKQKMSHDDLRPLD